ncbi:MAG: hypothetical protein GYA50_01620 [Eubacteriaceae bacterium]|nr:hypothetical protein [Eubacteriaceae bacterium]
MKKLLNESMNYGKPILLTIVCIAMLGYVISNITDNGFQLKFLGVFAIIFITFAITILFWINYFINKKNRSDDKEDYEEFNKK